VPARELGLAALALGRSGDPAAEACAVDLLERGLQETTGALFRTYLYAAGEIETADGLVRLAPLLNAALADADAANRAVAAWAAGALASATMERTDWAAIRNLAVDDGDPMVRAEAVAALGKALARQPDDRNSDVLRRAGGDPAARVRYLAVQGARLLAEAGGPVFAAPAAWHDPDFGVQYEASLIDRALASR
jgi:hypothetical protein